MTEDHDKLLQTGIGRRMIVMKCKQRKYDVANQVPAKGGEAYAVKTLNYNICQKLGYNRVIIQSDQERASKRLVDKVKLLKEVEVIPENSPVGDSQSNGNAENVVSK